VHFQEFAPLYSKKVLILDRDGTLNRDTGYEHNKEDLLVIPEAVDFLGKAVDLGFSFVMATNQGGVALGKFSKDQSLEFNAELAIRFAEMGILLSAAYICFHHPLSLDPEKRDCLCRKPKPGMLFRVLLDYGLEKSMVLMVGDQESDREAANAAGIGFRKIGSRNLWDLACDNLEEF
jgi:D-glycero-D-manno-heptose 1,7-bisphosphate phosphatase